MTGSSSQVTNRGAVCAFIRPKITKSLQTVRSFVVNHTVSVQLPAGYVGFNAQSLSYNLTLTTNQTFPKLNFALTPTNDAVVQNVYELVLSRPAGASGFQTELKLLNSGGPVGQVFTDLYTSPVFKDSDHEPQHGE
jgi:hypothetical protein